MQSLFSHRVTDAAISRSYKTSYKIKVELKNMPT